MTWENDKRCVRELRALDGESEEKFCGFARIDALLLKYNELQIRILTSGRSNIERSSKYTVMKTGK